MAKEHHTQAFIIALLVIFAATGVFVINAPSPTGYATAFSEETPEGITDENTKIKKNDFFIVGGRYKLQYIGADSIAAVNPVARFKIVDTDEILEVVAGSVGGTIKIGGGSYVFTPVSDPTFSDYYIKVDLNGDG